MIKRLFLALAFSAAVAFSVSAPAMAKEKMDKSDTGKSDKSDTVTKADNTKVNKEMRAKKEASADQQGQSKADVKMTQEIRRAVVKDKALSTYAHNVKIVTRDGKVTLKGPVRSESEKASIEHAAVKIAGKGNVKNELEVAPAKSKTESKSGSKSKSESKEPKSESKSK